MAELFIELLSEEIPARMHTRAREDLLRLLTEKFMKAHLQFTKPKVYSTPRRLTVVLQDIPGEQPSTTEEKRGPRVDAPQAAIDGFLKSVGKKLNECRQEVTPKGTFYFADVHNTGRPTLEIIPEIIQEILYEMSWPKSMNWGRGLKTWVRPLQSGICIFDNQALKFEVSFGESDDPEAPKINFSDTTQGHRLLAPSSFTVKSFEDYKNKLRLSNVILDQDERRKLIQEQIKELLESQDKKLTLKRDDDLLEEIVGIVEWPQAFLGSIEKEFMDLPPELLITSMRVHQRYFTLKNSSGKLAPHFVVIANTDPRDRGEVLVRGNERVLRARLSDAKFFYENDLKKTLEEHAKKLKEITFSSRLGTMDEKAKRLSSLAQSLANHFGVKKEDAKKAALICKADLVTDMVREFPELQGIIGRYYAAAEGLSEDIAVALAEHYSPKGPDDSCPKNPLSRLLALVDRLDTLVGFFAIGVQPTGSKDPFALRRACLGIIRLLEEDEELCLTDLFKEAYELYKDEFNKQKGIALLEDTSNNLLDFFLDRLKVYWRERGIRHDYIAATFSVSKGESLGLMLKRVMALKEFFENRDADSINLLAGYRRAANILRIEEQKDKISYDGKVDKALLAEKAEQALYEKFLGSQKDIEKALSDHNYTKVMKTLASLRSVIDTYFEKVMVNVEDKKIRKNRLNTLALIRNTLESVVDFSKIEEA